MRKMFIALLLTAAVATPALAQRGNDVDRAAARAERQQARSEARAQRSQFRATPPQQAQQAQQAQQVQQVQQAQQPQARGDRGARRGGQGRPDRSPQIQMQQAQQVQRQQAQMTLEEQARQPGRWRREGYRTPAQDRAGDPQVPAYRQGQRANGRTDGQGWQGNRSGDRGDWRGNRGDRQDWRNDRGGRGDYRNNGGNRNREWRNDRRYDWQRYRNSNRSSYRLPRYYAPRGWGYGYRRFGLGTLLDYSLFSQNYWINDPWSYRLPPAEYGYQWVRYYNDVILVDIDSGYVVDVIYGFFL